MTIEEMQHKLLSLIDDKMKLEKELETYQKALKMACAQNINNPLCTAETYKACCKSLGSCSECWECMYLHEAREE